MFEFGQKYRRGRKTFLFLYIKYAWLFNLLALAIFYLAWAVRYGPLHMYAITTLADHPDLYISVSMISQWLVLLGISLIVIGMLRGRIMYAHYKFILDDHAFNLYQGLFFARETTIPYQQISNVNINRPYHYRLFGIAQLDILTAADKSMLVQDGKKNSRKMLIPIIDTSIARRLSQQLMECASRKRKGEDLYAVDFDMDDDDAETEEILIEEKIAAVPAASVAAAQIMQSPPVIRPIIIEDLEGDDEVIEDETLTVESKTAPDEDLYPTIDLKNL